ncbi:MAG: CBS domain-containing protein [Oligoflexia bacterium]|nr:CBS domain-containing protein [Oligoflexia bacterium]
MAIDHTFFLSEILDRKIILDSNGKKVGKISDLLIFETSKIPEVHYLVVSRSFGHPSLYIPWDRVVDFHEKDIKITTTAAVASASAADFSEYEAIPKGELFYLKDYVLDKKILDIEDNEVEVVYDIVLVLRNNKLYVTEVDCGRYGFLRRLGLKFFVDFVDSLTERFRKQTVSWSYIQSLPKHIDRFSGNVKLKVLKEKLDEMPPVDLADVLEEMDPEQRVLIFEQLDPEQAADTLEEIDPNVQRTLIPALKKEKVVSLLEDMTPGQVADVLSVLPTSDAKSYLELLEQPLAQKVAAILDQQEESIQHLATNKFIAINPGDLVGNIERDFRLLAKECDVVMYLYVVDENKTLIGVIDIKELLQANEDAKIEDIMITDLITFSTQDTLKTAYDNFNRYGYRAIPLVDDNQKIIGVIPYRDVINLKHRFL